MRRYRSFKKVVQDREDGSTFSVCTLPLAPKLTDIQPKHASYGWNVGPLTQKMCCLNERIKALNRESMMPELIGLSKQDAELIDRSANDVFAP